MDQEVHRDDDVPVIAKKRARSLVSIMVRISFREISRDAGKADGDPKLLEFTPPDLSGAPAVLSCESPNELCTTAENGGRPGPRFEIDRLLALASKGCRNASKGDRRESEQVPHSETHSARR
jgi:hypothetical protein